MSDETRGSSSASQALPDAANLEWLRKHAKQRLRELREKNPKAKLSDAQLELARQYGFPSWRALKAHVDSLTVEGQLFDAAKKGDVEKLEALLDAHPEKLNARDKPYEHSLLHAAAAHGGLDAVDFLLKRGIDVNYREKGDNTYAMHWAAAAGSLDIVRRLADAGGDVVGHGDDHAMEIIGWASMWDGAKDDAHRAVVDFLLSRGAKHHIFTAIAMNLPDEVRRIVKTNPDALDQRRSHNEDFQRPLHYAVSQDNAGMVKLLLELGADPFATDGSGYSAVAYAQRPDVDRPIMEALAAQKNAPVLFAALGVGDYARAEDLLRRQPDIVQGDSQRGALHLMAKRGDARAVKWLLDHGVDPNLAWNHWGDMVRPLHLAVWGDHTDVVRILLAAGADPTIKDTQHDSDALGWAEFFGRVEIVRLLKKGG